MRWIQNHHLRYLQFPALAGQPGLWHGISARFMVTEGAPVPLNLGLKCGDPDQQVWTNRRRLMMTAGAGRAVFARQVHGSTVAVWDGEQSRSHAEDTVYLPGDALVTDVPGTALLIQTADCQSVLLFDPVRRIIGNVHSGWRGSLADIVGRTVRLMVERYQCRPEDLLCAIGPSLGPCCAEFIHYRTEIPRELWKYRREGDLFDFWRLTFDQLAQSGVPTDNISLSGICTRCNQHLFFSYRGEGPHAGRFAAAILLTE